MSFLQTKNASFKTHSRTILQPTTLSFEKGKIYGLMGHNGSGKSTLLKIMANQQKDYTGDVIINNQHIKQYSSKEFAKQIAYLPQTLPCIDYLNGEELVYMGRYAHHNSFWHNKAKDKDIVTKSLQLTHTECFLYTPIQTLSGGEKSRLFLAMLLAQESQFLLLDEPLAPLDINYQIEIMELILSLSHQLGIGVIIVIHDINLAATYCDTIIALKQGSVIFHDDAKKMMSEALLEHIFNIKSTIINHPSKNQKIAIF